MQQFLRRLNTDHEVDLRPFVTKAAFGTRSEVNPWSTLKYLPFHLVSSWAEDGMTVDNFGSALYKAVRDVLEGADGDMWEVMCLTFGRRTVREMQRYNRGNN